MTKQLWIAAIDLAPQPGTDPSHSAFCLPAPEIQSGSMRGLRVAHACQADGATWLTGNECCGGFRSNTTNTFACTSTVSSCSNVYEHCVTDADCCSSTSKCIHNLRTSTTPIVVVP